jgi:hypothetical protein
MNYSIVKGHPFIKGKPYTGMLHISIKTKFISVASSES